MKLKNKKGFTLVELLVVVTIIAILSVTAFIALGGQTLKARNAKRQEHLTTIQSALELSYTLSSTNVYPTVADFVATLVPEVISEIPNDPSSTDTRILSYVYAVDNAAIPKHFQLAATLEHEDGTYEALVVGNADSNLINGVGNCGADNDVIDSEACLPYSL